MNKNEFITALRKGLFGLPKDDIEERISFYSEMIDDRIEEGLSEEEAVEQIGSVEEIISQIVAITPLPKIAIERIKPKRKLSTVEIILLILGAPLWLSLTIALFAVIFSVYVSLWAVIISLWAAFGALIGSIFGGIAVFVALLVKGSYPTAIAMLGAATILAGLSIFLFYGCKGATKGILVITKKLALWIKKCFKGKEAA